MRLRKISRNVLRKLKNTNKQVVSKLKEIIYEEEKKISQLKYTNEVIHKKIVLFELIRAFDLFFLFQTNKKKMISNYTFGFNEALRIYYGSYVNKGRFPLLHSTKHTWSYANSIIQHCGKIGFCRKIISFIEANLADATLRNQIIEVIFKKGGVPEQADVEAYDWAQNLVDKHVFKPKTDEIKRNIESIKELLRNKVAKWKNHFIQYDTNPEIDKYFDKLAYYSISSKHMYSEFPQDAKFGGIKYKTYCKFVHIQCAVALKHYYFCHELLKKEKGIDSRDIFTIPRDRKSVITSSARYLRISEKEAEQILCCLTLSTENYEHHTSLPEGVSPPYIQVGENSLAHSIIGSTNQPIKFLNKELKRRFKKDYFNAVNAREKKFRKELYHLFPEDYYFKSKSRIYIKSSEGSTDIDATIYDSKHNILGLFQLKWQDVFGGSLKERYSRISNLYPAVSKWLDKLEKWVEETNSAELLKRLDLKENIIPSKVFIFVICRHNVFFTDVKPDKRAAWSSIWHMLQAISKIPTSTHNKIGKLHEELKKIEGKIFNEKIDIEEEKFEISNYTIKLKTKDS
ncbi:hypothetical protein GOV04_02675 [Candidatus Woesearchaeota archaeon]|nr:hypothetical protein [Candidatus Woesearchaeota archaeon]